MTDNTAPTPASPDEEPTAEELAAAGKIRPLEQLPSPWIVKGEPRIISQPTLEALSPADRQTIIDRAGSNDTKAITAALNDFLRDRQREVRILCGPGEGATETEREATDQRNQMRLMTKEYHRLEAELAEVQEHRTEYGPDGKPVPVPVYRLQGSRRSAAENRKAEVGEHMALIAGIQGDEAMKRAARADALHIRKVKSQIEEQREIERRAHHMASEERINAAARTKAKFL